MLYLNTKHIEEIGIDWEQTVGVIRNAVENLEAGNYAQPIKPYLRYRDPANRIIAMPAYIGGDFEAAGIKWIASFPKNIQQGIQRAHSVTVLNDANTGKPFATLNTALVSGIRTASVSGLILQEFAKVRSLRDVHLGIIGFGPIGQLHLQMAAALLGDKLRTVSLYDLNGVKEELIPASIRDRVTLVDSYEAAYEAADVFITCTVSAGGYIDKKPKDGALLLNVSLRDFKPEILDFTQSILVDDWEEVCRENTDIELMHVQRGLQAEDTRSLTDVICRGAIGEFPQEQAVLFNPMGMAVFDVAVAMHYYRTALERNVGVSLEE